MKQKRNRLLAIVLALVLSVNLFTTSVWAEGEVVEKQLINSGTCGENLTWTLSDDGILTISGTGEMTNWGWPTYTIAPWNAKNVRVVNIEEGVTSIGNYAFSRSSSLISVNISDSVTNIGAYAFNGCINLISVIIPKSVISIEKNAFCECTNLISVNLPEGLTSIGQWAFWRCNNLADINLPDSVTSIGEDAFYECKSLTHINIPASLTNIEYQVFSGCSNLESVEFPERLESIGVRAFSGCSSLRSVNISSGVNEINGGAFEYCTSLKSINLPDSVFDIKEWAFAGCSSLKEINVSPDNAYYSSKDGVLFNKEQTRLLTYPAGKEEKFYSIPEGVTDLENGSFDGSSNLVSLNFSKEVQSTGWKVFWGCMKLEEITVDFDSQYYSSEDGVLFNKDKTILVKYPDGKKDTIYSVPNEVTKIGGASFAQCPNLTKLKLGKNVICIDEDAFLITANLMDVYYAGTQAEWNSVYISVGNNGILIPEKHYNYIEMGDLCHVVSLMPECNVIDVDVHNKNCQLLIEFDQEIELGNGNVYICDFNDPQKIYRTISSEPNGERLSVVDGKTLVIDFHNRIKECVLEFGANIPKTLIPNGTKLSILIDEDVVRFKENTDDIFKIENKNSWNFTTKWGLTADIDYPQFTNSQKDFECVHYDVSDEIKKVFKKQGNKNGKKNKLKKAMEEDEWDSSCQGMAIVTALMYANQIDVSAWNALDLSGERCADIRKPKDSTEVYGTRDLINYYQLIQYLEGYPEKIDNRINKQIWKQEIDQIITLGENLSVSKEPFTIDMTLSQYYDPIKGNADGIVQKQGHTCLVIGYQRAENGNAIFQLYDPNFPAADTTLTITPEYQVIFNGQWPVYEGDIEGSDIDITAISHVTCAELEQFNIDNEIRNTKRDVRAAYTSINANLESEHTILYCTARGDFEITNAAGESLIQSGDEILGNMKVYSFTHIGVGNMTEYKIEVDASSFFKFTTNNKKSDFTVYQDDFYIDISTEGDVQSVSIIPGESAFVTSDTSYNYSTHVTPKEYEEKMNSIIGKASGNLTATYIDKDNISLSAEKLEEVTSIHYEGTDVTKETVSNTDNTIIINPGFSEKKGDVNEDSSVDSADLRFILRNICGKSDFTERQTKIADVTGDGMVDSQDLRKVLQFICGKIEEL